MADLNINGKLPAKRLATNIATHWASNRRNPMMVFECQFKADEQSVIEWTATAGCGVILRKENSFQQCALVNCPPGLKSNLLNHVKRE